MNSYIKTTNGYTSVENNKTNMSLTVNGSETTLKEQIAKKIVANQGNGNSYTLHQDILVINHSGKSTNISNSIDNHLDNSTVKWNKLIVQGKKGDRGEPEIFQKIGIAKIVKAARAAGILKSDMKKNVIWSIILFLISTSLNSLFFFYHLGNIHVLNNSFLLIESLLYLILLSLYFSIERYGINHNVRIIKTLAENANNFKTLAEKGKLFLNKVTEEVLRLDMPMAIVVDNIGTIDPFTLQVMKELLASDNGQCVGLILWIIVKNDNSEVENTWLSTSVHKSRSLKVDHCRA